MRPWLFFLPLFICSLLWPNAANAAPLKVALLLEHDQDCAWHELLKSGLAKAESDFGIQPEIIIASPESDQTGIFREAASRSDLLIVASDSLHEILRDNAGNYRRVMFGCLDAGIRAPNVMCVTFADEQAAFLAGAFAVLLSSEQGLAGINKDKIIGWLSGEDTPAMRTLYNGFYEGAQLAVPGVRVIQALTGSFAKSPNVAAKTGYLLDAGADVIALAAGAGNAEAARLISARGAWYVEVDKWEPAPNAVGAIAKKADAAIYEIIAAAATGKFRGKEIIVYDLENGGVDFVGEKEFLKKTAHRTSANLRRRADEIRREMKRGSIGTHSLRARTLCDCLD